MAACERRLELQRWTPRSMTRVADDMPSGDVGVAHGSRLVAGLAFALVSAATFGLSGPLARPLLEAGWSPGAIVLIRISIAALVVLPFGVVSLRGRWAVLRRNAGLVTVYGVLAVAG